VAPFAVLVIAVQQRLTDTRMANDFMPVASRDSFCAVAPKHNPFLQIDDAQARGQAFQNAVINIGIFERTHAFSRNAALNKVPQVVNK